VRRFPSEITAVLILHKAGRSKIFGDGEKHRVLKTKGLSLEIASHN
jgi:hypothetical protein